jgi:hypothetical protein
MDNCHSNSAGATLLVYSSELDSQQNGHDFTHHFQCTKWGWIISLQIYKNWWTGDISVKQKINILLTFIYVSAQSLFHIVSSKFNTLLPRFNIFLNSVLKKSIFSPEATASPTSSYLNCRIQCLTVLTSTHYPHTLLAYGYECQRQEFFSQARTQYVVSTARPGSLPFQPALNRSLG